MAMSNYGWNYGNRDELADGNSERELCRDFKIKKKNNILRSPEAWLEGDNGAIALGRLFF